MASFEGRRKMQDGRTETEERRQKREKDAVFSRLPITIGINPQWAATALCPKLRINN
jgi:hypothetical protein